MSACVAVINAGSSSIKFAVYDLEAGETALYRGAIEQIGVSPSLRVVDADGWVLTEHAWAADELDHERATAEVLKTARTLIGDRQIVAVGHRVVHGGTHYSAPVRVDSSVLASLRGLIPLAPLHQPFNLAAIETIGRAAPNLPQVACFDTAFHRRQPPLAQMFGLPRKYMDEGIRRYGFHGLSYEFVAMRLAELDPQLAEGRVIVAHLGNGASLCGLAGGRSMATSMGFTSVDGLLMGTRCGALDAGVLLHLMDVHGMNARAIEDLVYKRSGLLGVSGLSADMRVLRASTSAAAAQAVALFVYRVVREIGSITAALSGLDGLVFTGGIGANDAATRAEVAAGCAWLGVSIDANRSGAGAMRISPPGAPVSTWVIPTDEERMISRHTAAVLGLCREDA